MSEVQKAFVVGGFSEDLDFLWGLTNELSNGEHRTFETEALTWAQVHNDFEKFSKEAKHRALFGHSGATLHFAGVEAPMVFALAGVEPTPLHKSLTGAIKVGTNTKVGHDDGVIETGLKNGFLEVLKHPSTIQIPFRIRHFSTFDMLVQKAADFPEGRFYLPARLDEFGFGSDIGRVVTADAYGIRASYFGDWHNSAMLHPKEAARGIYQRLNNPAK
jgi:hypothetical protein